jgi:hypothetical protein
MLFERYQSDEFRNHGGAAGVGPRGGTVCGDARVVAVTSGGDPRAAARGVLGEGSPRVGELDEEMVYEPPGETLCSARARRIERITPGG